jgi:hypothetical protein
LAFTVPACGCAVAYFSPSHLVIPEFFLCCPVYSFYLTFATRYPFEASHFWWSIAIIHILTWLLLLIASRILPRIWQDRPAEKGKTRYRDRWRTWIYGKPAKRKALRKRLLDINPFLWLAARARFKPISAWISIGIIAAWWLFVRAFLESSWHDEILSFTTALLLNSLLKLWVAVEAGQRLADDQKLGALELLLSTPLTVSDILRGQFLALRRQFLGPLIFVVIVELGLTVALSHYTPLDSSRTHAFGNASLFLLAADLAALCWVAIASALTAKNPNQASVNTILRILLLPWVAWLTIITITNVWLMLHGSNEPGWKFYLYLWVCLGLVADAAFGLPAWWRVRTRFRGLALQRLSTSKPVM